LLVGVGYSDQTMRPLRTMSEFLLVRTVIRSRSMRDILIVLVVTTKAQLVEVHCISNSGVVPMLTVAGTGSRLDR